MGAKVEVKLNNLKVFEIFYSIWQLEYEHLLIITWWSVHHENPLTVPKKKNKSYRDLSLREIAHNIIYMDCAHVPVSLHASKAKITAQLCKSTLPRPRRFAWPTSVACRWRTLVRTLNWTCRSRQFQQRSATFSTQPPDRKIPESSRRKRMETYLYKTYDMWT